MGDIEKIQVNALIDRYVMQVKQPQNSHYYNFSHNNIISKKRPSGASYWGTDNLSFEGGGGDFETTTIKKNNSRTFSEPKKACHMEKK